MVVVNKLQKDQLLRGVPVARIDERGHGVVGIRVRKDKESFEFTFNRAIPGERLHLRVVSAKHDRFSKKKEPGRYRIDIEQRGAASPHETTPRCVHFRESCGGCAFQHLAYEAQLREKHALLALQLKQYQLEDGVELRASVPSSAVYGFHSRTEFRFFLRDGVRLGLHPVESPVPIPIRDCQLHPEASQRAFESTLRAARSEPEAAVFDERTGRGWLCSAVFRAALPAPGHGHEVLVTLVTIPSAPRHVLQRLAASITSGCPDVVGVTWNTGGGEPAERVAGWRSASAGGPQEALAGRPHLVQQLGGACFDVAPEAFFRPNLLLADGIGEAVRDLVAGGPCDTAWDAFSGQGCLSLPFLAPRCQRLIALDRSESSLASLSRNARARGLAHKVRTCRVDLGSPAELRALPGMSAMWAGEGRADQPPGGSGGLNHAHGTDSLPHPDVLIADPGRNGMPKAFRRFLYALQVHTVVYIGSGRPLLRDCTLLQRRGYGLRVMVPFDSHPHTARLEVVVLLQWQGQPAP